MGMSVRQLAEEAGVDRGRLAKLEAGEGVRETTLAKVLTTLDRLEHEMGMDVPDAQPQGEAVVEFRVTASGVDVVVPVRDLGALDLAALETVIDRIVRRIQPDPASGPDQQ